MIYNWKNKTDEDKVSFILGNQSRMEDVRALYNDLWTLIITIFRPRRYDLLGHGKKGKQYGARIYNQHPSNALAKFTGGRVGYMVNRAVPWIQFITLDKRLMKLDHIKEYLNDAAEQVLYAINRSNFYSSTYPHALDADSVGTGVMIPLLDEKADRVIFDVVHPRDSYLASDEFGFPEVYHRKTLELTRASADRMFGPDVLPDVWYEDGSLKQPFEMDEYLWAVYPNSDREHDKLSESEKPYKVFIILLSSQTRRATGRLVYERGRDHFPIIYRTGRESGCDYGTSISADCLTAALVGNKLAEKSVDAAHKAVQPPKVASKTLRATLRNKAGATTWVDDINREGVKVWQDKLNWPITDAQIERLDTQIDDRMFIRFFEMLNAGDIKVRTAYEVSQMMAEKATLMSVIVDTFEQEALEPSIGVILHEETRAGRMPPVPEEIAMTGSAVSIRYLGPLAQLQRSLLRSKGTIDALALIGQMMQMNEKVGWKFDWMEIAEDVAIAQGMPQRHILSDAEVNRIEEENRQKQQMAETAAMLEAGGKAAPGLGKSPEVGSPIDSALAEAGAL